MNNYDKKRLEQKEESLNRILDAAVVCFGKNGYSNTSIQDIASLAGVSHGLIGKYFETKENLLSNTYVYVSNKSYPFPDEKLILKDLIEMIIAESVDVMKNRPDFFDFFQMLMVSSDLPNEYVKTREEYFVHTPIYTSIEEWKKERNLPNINSYVCFIQFLRTIYTILNLYKSLAVLDDNEQFNPHFLFSHIVNTLDINYRKIN